jgi:hypothetical protein
MIYDAPTADVLAVAGIVLLLVGTVLLLSTRDRFGVTPQGARRLVWAFMVLETSVVLWAAAMWIDGSGWLPGRIIVAVVVLAGLVVTVPRILRLARKHDADTTGETTAHE